MSDPAPIVLVADDDPDILALAVFPLERAGYRVLTAADGEEALRLATEHRPAVAVLDVSMPRLSGLEVTRSLRADERTRATRVILLTARARVEDEAAGRSAGADDYIRKPFSPRDLPARVEALLARA